MFRSVSITDHIYDLVGPECPMDMYADAPPPDGWQQEEEGPTSRERRKQVFGKFGEKKEKVPMFCPICRQLKYGNRDSHMLAHLLHHIQVLHDEVQYCEKCLRAFENRYVIKSKNH